MTKEQKYTAFSVLLVIIFGIFIGIIVLKKDNYNLYSPSEDNPPKLNTEETIKIVAFGDSLTAGYGLLLSESYPSLLQKYLTDLEYRVYVTNMGLSGETSAGGARRIDFALQEKPDIILIGLGGNDALRGLSPTETKKNIEIIVQKAIESEAKVILLGMQAPDNLGDEYTNSFNNLYEEIAMKYNISLVPFFLEGVALNKILNQEDGIHPTRDGYQYIVLNNIAPIIVPILEDEVTSK